MRRGFSHSGLLERPTIRCSAVNTSRSIERNSISALQRVNPGSLFPHFYSMPRKCRGFLPWKFPIVAPSKGRAGPFESIPTVGCPRRHCLAGKDRKCFQPCVRVFRVHNMPYPHIWEHDVELNCRRFAGTPFERKTALSSTVTLNLPSSPSPGGCTSGYSRSVLLTARVSARDSVGETPLEHPRPVLKCK